MSWSALYERARRQHGVVSLACATVVGLARSSLATRATGEAWTRLQPGVWLLPGATATLRARAVAATLAAPGAAVCGWSAAALHGIHPATPTRMEVVRSVGVGDLDGANLRARRSRALRETDVTAVDGNPATNLARTLPDLARVADRPKLRDLTIDARLRDRAVLDAIAADLARDPRFPGRPAMRWLLDELGDDGSDSGFEHRVVDRLTLAGLRPDRQQIEVATHLGVRRFDVGYLDGEVAIDAVGFAFHSERADLTRDVHRGNAVAAVDRWLVLRLTWEMFHRDWDAFEALLRQCLARRRARR
jgi:hypothetical protein